MPYTSHGFWYGDGKPTDLPVQIARCGGPKLCRVCRQEAENASTEVENGGNIRTCEMLPCTDKVAYLAEIFMNDLGVAARYFICADHATGKKPVDGQVISAKRIHKPRLTGTIFGALSEGTRFYLTASGVFPDVVVKWGGWGEREEKDPQTGEPTGRTLRTVFYTNQRRLQWDLPLELPVWVAS
jgi:hypothetical protein